MFVIKIFCPGEPINGVTLGLFDGDELGESVKNKRLLSLSVYRYLTALSDVLLTLVNTASQ